MLKTSPNITCMFDYFFVRNLSKIVEMLLKFHQKSSQSGQKWSEVVKKNCQKSVDMELQLEENIGTNLTEDLRSKY